MIVREGPALLFHGNGNLENCTREGLQRANGGHWVTAGETTSPCTLQVRFPPRRLRSTGASGQRPGAAGGQSASGSELHCRDRVSHKLNAPTPVHGERELQRDRISLDQSVVACELGNEDGWLFCRDG